MKKGLSLSAILLMMVSISFAGAASANSIQWHEYSPSVVQQAKNANRPIMIFAMSSTCHWCENMQNNTFASPAVVKMVNENYYPVILHADVDREADIKFHIESVPKLLFLSGNGSVKKIYSGYVEPATMMQYLTGMLP